jgi:hypothetical protein
MSSSCCAPTPISTHLKPCFAKSIYGRSCKPSGLPSICWRPVRSFTNSMRPFAVMCSAAFTLEDRIAALGRSASWTDIIADLNSLAETEIEQDGKRFTLRSACVRQQASQSVAPALRCRHPSAKPFTADLEIQREKCSAIPPARLQLSWDFNHFIKNAVEEGLWWTRCSPKLHRSPA